jgi:hypothetical protein
MFTTCPALPENATLAIEEHLKKKPIRINHYRKHVGDGKSQCFGLVNKRCLETDISRQSWCDAKLHHLLMEFAEKYVTVPFTSVQVNEDFNCAPHYDTNNIGNSYIVAFGQFEGGNLKLCLSETDTREIDVRVPILFDGSKILHSTTPFTGKRYSIVYHTVKPRFPLRVSLAQYKAIEKDGKWVIQNTKPDGTIEYLTHKHGLAHPLLGRKKNATV